VWNISNEPGSFSLSFDGGLKGALSLTHIETPSGILNIQNGSLGDIITQQQIKTYALYPVSLPFAPDTSGLESATATPPVSQATPTVATAIADAGQATQVIPVTNTPPVPSFTQTAEPTGQDGKGCLFGLFTLLGFLKN
jgi:hypothetical protein